MIPDPSFDLDGDGFVSQKDFKVGHYFDKDKDGRLNTSERANALNAYATGEADKIWQQRPKKGMEQGPIVIK